MPKLSFSDVRLNYDPSAPQQRFRAAGLEAAFAQPSAQLPSPPTWPADGVPQAISLTPPRSNACRTIVQCKEALIENHFPESPHGVKALPQLLKVL
jgi:hypothetical protein